MGSRSKSTIIIDNAEGISLEERSTSISPDNYERFCQLYIVDFNGAKAYREAGFNIDVSKEGASNSASACALRLLRYAKVQERVRFLAKQHKKAMLCNQETIKQRMVDVLNADIIDYCGMDEEGHLITKPLHIMGKRELIQEISSDAEGRVKLRFVSKDRALEHLAKIEKLLVDSHEISGELMVRQQLEANEAYKMRLAKLAKVPKNAQKQRQKSGGRKKKTGK